MRSGSVHIERRHFIADLDSISVRVNSGQVVPRLEEVTAIHPK